LPIRRVDCLNQTIDDSVSECLILELLAEDKGLNQQADLFPVTSSVPYLLAAEYSASVYPLNVKCKDSWIVVRKWNSPFLVPFPTVFRGCREVRGIVAEQVFVYSVLVLIRPDDYSQSLDPIADSISDKYIRDD